MNLAARELGLLAAAKSREAIHAKARAIREAMGLKPAPILNPVLILSLGDRVA